MQSWLIDPATGDYVLQNGQPVQSDSLKVPAYFRLKTKRGKWLYAPDKQYGSDFYTVVKRPSENGNNRLENVALAALQPILDDGRASAVEAIVTVNRRSASGLEVHITDAAGEVETETFPGLGL